jgi:hypothetical protein
MNDVMHSACVFRSQYLYTRYNAFQMHSCSINLLKVTILPRIQIIQILHDVKRDCDNESRCSINMSHKRITLMNTSLSWNVCSLQEVKISQCTHHKAIVSIIEIAVMTISNSIHDQH